jgi:hypothetical protein
MSQLVTAGEQELFDDDVTRPKQFPLFVQQKASCRFPFAESTSVVAPDFLSHAKTFSSSIEHPHTICCNSQSWCLQHWFPKVARHGISHHKCLRSLSDPDNHRPDFVLMLHNMFERQRMVKNTFLRCNDDMAQSFANINKDEMQNAVSRMLDGSRGANSSWLGSSEGRVKDRKSV